MSTLEYENTTDIASLYIHFTLQRGTVMADTKFAYISDVTCKSAIYVSDIGPQELAGAYIHYTVSCYVEISILDFN